MRQVEAMAAEKRSTAPQLALAWVLAQGKEIMPIPATKRCACLEENLGALRGNLTPADLGRLEAALPRGAVADRRYPEQTMGMIDTRGAAGQRCRSSPFVHHIAVQ